ncbi:MAG: esterase [Lysobacterales bacterium 14-68-21]|jgi:acetyl esterase/lipase|nr:MAG: esterase [Xanthomonadales bacterium 15-68-25]OZB65368.1 MAG: esterase [Xanthomonadales bacterium 14-68-21]
MDRKIVKWWFGACMLATAGCASAQMRGGLLERWRERQAQSAPAASLPAGTRVVRDVAYGDDPRQRLDVYAPAGAHDAPVILMVHGGGWRRGDKSMSNVVANKVAYWVPRGVVVISVNYRMLPDTLPLEQARDVARALSLAQRRAAEWGGAPDRFVLMGHSAGAHLVSLLAAEPQLAREQGARPWRGTVSLDSASLDVVQTMNGRHFRLYDEAFGSNPADWLAASPLQQMHAAPAPFLAVCSSRRQDSCPQAHTFVAKVRSLGGRGDVLEEDLSHEEINANLGAPSEYTTRVDAFLRSVL